MNKSYSEFFSLIRYLKTKQKINKTKLNQNKQKVNRTNKQKNEK